MNWHSQCQLRMNLLFIFFSRNSLSFLPHALRWRSSMSSFKLLSRREHPLLVLTYTGIRQRDKIIQCHPFSRVCNMLLNFRHSDAPGYHGTIVRRESSACWGVRWESQRRRAACSLASNPLSKAATMHHKTYQSQGGETYLASLGVQRNQSTDIIHLHWWRLLLKIK